MVVYYKSMSTRKAGVLNNFIVKITAKENDIKENDRNVSMTPVIIISALQIELQ